MTEGRGSAPVLYVVGFAAPPLLYIPDLITAARQRGWDTCLVLTPTAVRWLETSLPELTEATGHPIRSTFKLPGEPDVLPPADAILAAPVTFNSINKWAAGISDTLALGLVTEAIGKRLPLIAVPSLNQDQEVHGAYGASVRFLREAGVTVLLDDDGHALRRVHADNGATYPWDLVLDTVGQSVAARSASPSA